ncbi:MAG: winged helix-turn-helix transcriptional regulator [Acidimicrobiales bacterium]|nr:winged helix-turn-helix transcriptional regulator [Acidimicrobiales bacterium]
MPTSTAVHVATAAKLFRGFSEPTRLAILLALVDGEQRVKDLVDTIGGSQGNISGHVACLKECGLVADRVEGRQIYYRAAHPEITNLLRAAEQLLAATGEQIDLCPNYSSDTPPPVAPVGRPRSSRAR